MLPAVYLQWLAWGFGLAVILGFVVSRSNFCTMGAVSDLVNMGDSGRFRAWVFAIAVAMAGVLLLEALGVINLDRTMPPYRTANFDWLRYILGGTLFGIGMTLAGGCVNKTLVRIGGGNLRSLVVLLFGGIMAYLMTMTDFYHYAFHVWISPTILDLSQWNIESQALPRIVTALTGGDARGGAHWLSGGLVVALLVFWVFRSPQFRGRLANVVGGALVGVLVVAAWYLTGGPFGQSVIEEVAFLDYPPRGVGVMSFTFVNPMGQTLNLLAHPTDPSLLTFGVAILTGVIVGSFIDAVSRGGFRLEGFRSLGDLLRHVAGGILMGTGGVLAMGCTIGQGITGLSTMAVGSALAFAGFVFGAALTMKVEYHRLLDEEAGLIRALRMAISDLYRFPASRP